MSIYIINGIRLLFVKIHCTYSELMAEYNVSLRTLLQQAVSEPEFYGDFIFKNLENSRCNSRRS